MNPLLPLLLTSLIAGLSGGSIAYAQPIQTLKISQIRPTQPAIGDDEVKVKMAQLRGDQQALLNKYCEDNGAKKVKTFDKHSSLADTTSFTCVAKVGTEPEKVKSAVLAPDHHIYLTDGHHTLSLYRALAANHDFPFTVRITHDFSQLASMQDFWRVMQQQHLTWLQDPNGHPITPVQLPLQVGLDTLQNDPYRSIVYFLRGIAYDKPEQAPPFLEFYLGSWLRTHQPVNTEQLTTKAGYMAYLQRAALALVSASGSEQATNKSDAPTLSQLGQRKTVNERKLTKLAEKGGKLSQLFQE